MELFLFQILFNVTIGLIALVIAYALETSDPTAYRYAQVIAVVIIALIYIGEFLLLGATNNWIASAIPFIALLFVANFLSERANTLPGKSVSAAWGPDGKVIGQVTSGGGFKNMTSTLQEIRSNADNPIGSTLNTQVIQLKIPEVLSYALKGGEWRGIVENLKIWIQIRPDEAVVLTDLEGGEKFILETVVDQLVPAILEHYINDEEPTKFEERKNVHHQTMEKELLVGITKFLRGEDEGFSREGIVLPYDVVFLKIGSTVLEAGWYEQKQTQAKLNYASDQLAARLKKFTKEGYSEETLLVGTGIVKKNIEEKNVKTEVGLTKDTTKGIADGIIGVLNTLKK